MPLIRLIQHLDLRARGRIVGIPHPDADGAVDEIGARHGDAGDVGAVGEGGRVGAFVQCDFEQGEVLGGAEAVALFGAFAVDA